MTQPNMLHRFALAWLVVASAFLLPPYANAFDDFDVLDASAGSVGTVETVRDVPTARDLHAFDLDVLEHKIQPDSQETLLVRLDTGPLVIVTDGEARRLKAGERVRVVLNGSIVSIQREAGYGSVP